MSISLPVRTIWRVCSRWGSTWRCSALGIWELGFGMRLGVGIWDLGGFGIWDLGGFGICGNVRGTRNRTRRAARAVGYEHAPDAPQIPNPRSQIPMTPPKSQIPTPRS